MLSGCRREELLHRWQQEGGATTAYTRPPRRLHSAPYNPHQLRVDPSEHLRRIAGHRSTVAHSATAPTPAQDETLEIYVSIRSE